MKITIFNKTIEIDENNKGIQYFLENLDEPINEIITTHRLRLREDISSDDAAEKLRSMTAEELKECIMQNIKDALAYYDFSEEYAKYIE